MKKISALEKYDIEKGERSVLHEFEGVIEAPNWLRDGDTLLYNSGGRIWKYSIRSGKSELLFTGFLKNCNNDHVPLPDNRKLALSGSPGGKGEEASEIYVLPMEGGTPEKVTKEGPSYLHGWSPDGKELAYCAFRNGKADIYVCPAEGGEETRLTDQKGYNDGPEYSPDGRHIWFNSTRNGLMQIFRMNRDGSGLTQMTFEENNHWFPHVSPDGRRVAYLSFRKGDLEPWQHLPDKKAEIWLMDYDGNGKRLAVSLFGGQGTINVNSWSPDSRSFAFVSYRYADS